YTSAIDGTIKLLYRLHDGNLIEGVLMNYKYGNTLCVSTQVGCRMGCKFCASTLGGLVRNLSAGEILGQVVAVNRYLGGDLENRKITNIVLMGSGEPLDNFDNVIKFLYLVNDVSGLNISMRNISLSTCGIAPKIDELAKLNLQINLTISLHSADQVKREEIMPIARAYSLETLMISVRNYFEATKRRVIFEYTLIDDANDSYSDALKLANLTRNISAHINLIRLNPVKETKMRGTSDIKAKKFLEYLTNLNVSATLRRQMGVDIEGACGQLRQRYIEEDKE
ncbi:MAG: 23S rRNA (adenine(2503)-C(2))-methyltransferase RlmN, partial [Clostridia bacterium]